MANGHHTRTASERLVTALQRARVADVEQALTRKRMTDTERDIVRKAHAMLHGDAEAADRWMEEVVELFADERLPERTLRLARLVDAVAETA